MNNSTPVHARTALLIDAENLVRGFRGHFQPDPQTGYIRPEHYQDFFEQMCEGIEGLFNFISEDVGHVVYANAYADWRDKDLQAFQIPLHKKGASLVFVVSSPHGKNAVDVKIAADAIEALFTLPHVDTFVIVSGDRDFIHILHTLRKHGKRIVGIAPRKSYSKSFASLCDRFVFYESLVQAQAVPDSAPGAPASPANPDASDQLARVKQILFDLLSPEPGGISGSKLKMAIKRIDPTFDERQFNFRGFREFLESQTMRDTVRVQRPEGEGDINVFLQAAPAAPAPTGTAAPASAPLDVRELVRMAQFSQFGITPNRAVRQQVIARCFHVLDAARDTPLVFEAWMEQVFALEDLPISRSELEPYWKVLFQARVFWLADTPEPVPLSQRGFTLLPDIKTADELLFRYEGCATYKLLGASMSLKYKLSHVELAAALGLAQDETPGGSSNTPMTWPRPTKNATTAKKRPELPPTRGPWPHTTPLCT